MGESLFVLFIHLIQALLLHFPEEFKYEDCKRPLYSPLGSFLDSIAVMRSRARKTFVELVKRLKKLGDPLKINKRLYILIINIRFIHFIAITIYEKIFYNSNSNSLVQIINSLNRKYIPLSNIAKIFFRFIFRSSTKMKCICCEYESIYDENIMFVHYSVVCL